MTDSDEDPPYTAADFHWKPSPFRAIGARNQFGFALWNRRTNRTCGHFGPYNSFEEADARGWIEAELAAERFNAEAKS